jgi:hypothetical protein
MKPAEKVLRSWIRSLPTDTRNVNIFNADGVLTRDRYLERILKVLRKRLDVCKCLILGYTQADG